MSIVTVVAVNDDAERLWKYILAYRKHVGNTSVDSKQDHPLEDNVTVGVIPLEEAIDRAENPKE
jgi:hypothetical protein